MLSPFTASIYFIIRTVAVILELLKTGKDRGIELRKTAEWFLAIERGSVLCSSKYYSEVTEPLLTIFIVILGHRHYRS